MGQSAAETVREIEDTRDRLEGDLQALQQRLPAPARVAKRAAAIAVGGGVGGTVLLVLFKRWRKKKAAQKVVAAAIPVPTVIKVLPDEWAERVSASVADGRWKPWAAGAAGVWLALRLAELRQLRRMNRAMVASR
jgi:hypothetical protein